ncbi:MAG TPA: proline iminopeptidase-family hydrolase [Oligoflexia bacterium]|nr:proline iminopeptidase-family hydrolase [Oligoflexia bacterium]HMP49065.1 proline iminopeptidase-family hydrolase [Oligoflexia bacterium]
MFSVNEDLNITEELVPVPGGRVFARLFGGRKSSAFEKFFELFGSRAGIECSLINLHGGPGYPHDYLLGLSGLSDILPVLFYDQLGCGGSDRPSNLSLWRISRFVEEIETIREFFKIKTVILHGHSWGTILALEYALRYPERVRGIVFESPCINISRWKLDSEKFLESLSQKSRDAINNARSTYRFNSKEFIEAVDEYNQRYLHPDRPQPDLLLKCNQNSSTEVYTTMWGPCEFIVSGSLKDYDRSSSLSSLSVPVLYTAGEHDEVSLETLEGYARETPGSYYKIFDGAHHFPHLEAENEYLTVMKDFLSDVLADQKT